jgi:hypothetical protein
MSKRTDLPQKARRKRAVRARDRDICTNCRRPETVVDILDVDHNVPRGAGGSELLSNNSTLCRRCHEAKHGDGLAPTVEIQSTGAMTDYEFKLFRQFVDQVVPALARQVDVALVPEFDLDDCDAWHIPVGDVLLLDEELRDVDDEYASTRAADYM